MDTLFSTFLLFIAAISALLTYLIIPRLPVVALAGAAAVALAAGVWSHWTQFSVDYRTSTWQEQLRYYASYVMVLVVILLSYAFYVFGWSGVSDYVESAADSVRNAGRRATSQVVGGTTRGLTAAGNALFGSSNSGRNVSSENTGIFNIGASNRGGNVGILE